MRRRAMLLLIATVAGLTAALPAAGASGSAPAWGTYHRTPGREGDVSLPEPHGLAKAWAHSLQGAVYGQPLVANGLVYVATERDVVYALAQSDGHPVWAHQVGHAVPRDQLPCGNIDPLGITSTMVLSADGRTLYLAAERQTAHGPHHFLFAYNALDGTMLWMRLLDVTGHDPVAHQQRGALALANGRVYVPFGGLAGDCGDYVGYVAGVATDGHGDVAVWQVPTTREGGIWAASGPAVGADGSVYVAVGNGAQTSSYDGSDSVTRLSPDLRRLSYFAPHEWAQDNQRDLDLGSMGPLRLADDRFVVAGKNGTVYLLRAHDLGGIGGQQAALSGCHAYGGAARHGWTAFLPCTEGVRAVQVSGTSLAWRWTAPSGVTGSPVFAGGVVWALDTGNGSLHLLDANTGSDRGSYPVGAVSRFMSPTIVPGWVYVGTLDGITAFRIR